jgi:colicin import membrane protein
MNLFNKKVIAATLGAVFAIGAMGSVFAAEAGTANTVPSDAGKTATSQMPPKPFASKIKHGSSKDLEALAAEKGITVDELKAQLDAGRQAKLEAEAAEKGITVDELKALKEQEHTGLF